MLEFRCITLPEAVVFVYAGSVEDAYRYIETNTWSNIDCAPGILSVTRPDGTEKLAIWWEHYSFKDRFWFYGPDEAVR